jgi:protease I
MQVNIKYLLFLILLIILLPACSNKKQEPVGNDQKNMQADKKLLVVIAPKDFRDIEYTAPVKIFKEFGIDYKTTSIQQGDAYGVEGTLIKVDLPISDVNIDEYDGVVFIGGPGMAEIINDESQQILAEKFYKAGKLTSAICVAPAILAKAGILKGKKATAFSSVKTDIEAGGAVWQDEFTVIDGSIITANGPEAAEMFGEAIAKALAN